MDYSLSATHSILSLHLSSPSKLKYLDFNLAAPFALKFPDRRLRRPLLLLARAGFSHCEPSRSSSGFNTPLQLRSSVGKFLNSVFQNQRNLFQVFVAEELKLLADDRNGAVSRMFLSSASDEACLHRRIAQLKEHDCQIAVQDVMYMLMLYKFSEIRVPLVPKLSRCIYNGRLEIVPSKDWELESIHSLEILQMVREHVAAVIGLKANSSVTDSWATTEIQRLQIGRLYANSIMYGYFVKSASNRLFLEQCLSVSHQNVPLSCRTSLQFPEPLLHGQTDRLFSHISNTQSIPSSRGSSKPSSKHENLKCYMMNFDAAALRICAKLRSREAANLMEMHSGALFGDGTEEDEVILTSFSSLKRLILEAVAFGSFLWETEEYVNSVFKLKDNQ
ncbi:UV-B-induced protein At3g17800, chloroplastic-like [Euphorbia lathyris]|uniref:UV-B-induced protein At3g17800, chloroplastic-like n=1 Tax=Euphorbia lathyris TaxID=212925 RepID=UPI00331388B6